MKTVSRDTTEVIRLDLFSTYSVFTRSGTIHQSTATIFCLPTIKATPKTHSMSITPVE